MIIIGAGMTGLLAGTLDRRATVLEAQPSLPANHNAVLRFRSDKIALALNIPFLEVRVLKDIVVDGVSVPLTPRWANAYANKVIGRYVGRSILSLEPARRFIAPRDFVAQMAEMVGPRLELNANVHAGMLARLDRPLISTIPLPKLLELLGERIVPVFHHEAIRVMKWHVPGAELFQTVYFPGEGQAVYRASMTGDELMVEAIDRRGVTDMEEVFSAFRINPTDAHSVGDYKQRLGKIQELDPETRKGLLGQITREHRIWCLGRYATWRNVLLDDVLEDFWHIRAMMRLNPYDTLKAQV